MAAPFIETDLATFGDAEACLRQLEASRKELVRMLEGMADETLYSRPDEETWSPALIAEHIAIAEDSFGKVIRFLRRAVQSGTVPNREAKPGTLRPDGRPIAPDVVTPSGDKSREELFAMLNNSRKSLLEQVEESGELLNNPAAFPHSFFGQQNGLGWLRAATFHEQHHLPQIEKFIR